VGFAALPFRVGQGASTRDDNFDDFEDSVPLQRYILMDVLSSMGSPSRTQMTASASKTID